MLHANRSRRKTRLRAAALLCAAVLAAVLPAQTAAASSTASGSGSASQSGYTPADYILETPYKDDFRILQLTDIHLANKDDRARQYKFLDLTISEANADMIILCGDSFTFADKRVAKELFAFIDSYGVPWSITFGNHDEQCYFSIDWLTNFLNNYGSNCLFKDIQDDDVFGNSNYAVNLMDGDTIREQLIIMDSNRYNYGEYWGYDYFKDSQIAWYEDLVNYTTEQNGGSVVPSAMFFHIPLPEFQDAWDLATGGQEIANESVPSEENAKKDLSALDGEATLEYGGMQESVSSPKYNSGFFDVIEKLGSTKAILVGHDHVNDARMLYKGIYLCYGVNSTDRIYYDQGLMGGHVMVIHPDNSLDFEHIYHTYSEVE